MWYCLFASYPQSIQTTAEKSITIEEFRKSEPLFSKMSSLGQK
jgi:hypothetical protein